MSSKSKISPYWPTNRLVRVQFNGTSWSFGIPTPDNPTLTLFTAGKDRSTAIASAIAYAENNTMWVLVEDEKGFISEDSRPRLVRALYFFENLLGISEELLSPFSRTNKAIRSGATAVAAAILGAAITAWFGA